MEKNILNPKIKGNAISAYFMVLLSFGFLFNKTDENINNDFVKSHTISAFILHLLFFIIIFISLIIKNNLFNEYITPSIFIINFFILLYGVYKAKSGETLKISEIFKISKAENAVKMYKKKEGSEKNKFELFLSYIPFISYLSYSHLKYNNTYKLIFKNNVKINVILSLIIMFVYIRGNINLTLILILFYLVGVAFIGLILVLKDDFLYFYVEKLNKIKKIEIYIKSLFEYLFMYLKGDFIAFKHIHNKNIKMNMVYDLESENLLGKLENINFPPYLIYFPIVNLIFIKSLKTKYRYHIINGFSITILFILLLIIFREINSVFLLLLYPICFGIGNLKTKLAYKQAITFYIFYSFIALHKKFKKFKKEKNIVKESNYKIENNNLEKPSS